MQTGSPSSSQLLTIGDEGLKAFNMSILGDSSDYQWKEFQGSVPGSRLVLKPQGFFFSSCSPAATIHKKMTGLLEQLYLLRQRPRLISVFL